MTRPWVALVALVLALPATAQARPGDLDETFSRDGIARVDLSVAWIDSLGVQSDGSIVVGGVDRSDNGYAYVVARYGPDGRPDPGFGDGGVVRLGSDIYGAPQRMALSGDRILLAGTVGTNSDDMDFAVARLLADGQLDPSFADNGFARIGLPGFDEFGAMTPTAGGGVLVVGFGPGAGQSLELRLVRLDQNGDLDPSFSGDGRQEIAEAGPDGIRSTAIKAAVTAADGATYVASGMPFGEVARVHVLKLTPQGDPDPGYGGGGTATATGGGAQDVADLAIDEQGRVVFGGPPCRISARHGSCAAIAGRFTLDGYSDPSFGGSGVLNYDGGIGAVLTPPGGDLLLAGSDPTRGRPGSLSRLRLLRDDGEADLAFGNGGVALAETGSDGLLDAALAPDGKIVASSLHAIARFEVGPGPPDADADGLRDGRDLCPLRFARHRQGCPLVPRLLRSLEWRGHRVTGAVTASERGLRGELRGCLARVPVRLMEVRPGPDRLVASTETLGFGYFRLDAGDASGHLYVKAPSRIRPELGRCAAVRRPAPAA